MLRKTWMLRPNSPEGQALVVKLEHGKRLTTPTYLTPIISQLQIKVTQQPEERRSKLAQVIPTACRGYTTVVRSVLERV